MEPATAETAKCSKKYCGREAVDGFLTCPACRQAVRKCFAARRDRGQCRRCARPALIGYARCHRCKIQSALYSRRHYDYRVERHLYVASTPRRLKVGRSVDFDRRREELRRYHFAGGPR